LAELNAALLAGLERYQKENLKMFRKSKTKSLTGDEFKRKLNDLLDQAEQAHLGKPAIITILSNAIDAMRYSTIVNAPSSYHFSVSAPPSPSTVEQIANLIRGRK
jgi:hypothetical protein